MKKLAILTVLIFIFKNAKGQDTDRRFEFGSTLITVNSFYTNNFNAADKPAIEVMNGLFFRYTKNRLGLRVHASYSDNSTSYASPAGWSDGYSGDVHNKDFRIGVGIQYSILKHREWLYSFCDLSYRNEFSTGHYYGGIWGANDSFSSTGNGFDSFLGLGFKIKLLKYIFLSPELGYSISTKFIDKTTTPQNTGKSSAYDYTETNINPVLKLHLTVKF